MIWEKSLRSNLLMLSAMSNAVWVTPRRVYYSPLSNFWLVTGNSISAGALPQTPLGALTALPSPLAGFKAAASRQGGGRERDGEREGGGKGREDEGREGREREWREGERENGRDGTGHGMGKGKGK